MKDLLIAIGVAFICAGVIIVLDIIWLRKKRSDK